MKFAGLIFAATSLAHLSAAQYFSKGWQPGQPVSAVSAASAAYAPAPSDAASTATTPDVAPTAEPAQPFSPLEELKKLRAGLRDKLDPSNLLQAKPVAQLFEKAGINITEKVAIAKTKSKLWDDRITLITDENWGEIVVNETLTEEEEKERVWFVVITTAALRRDAVAKMVDENFDLTHNLTLEANDLPNLRFGRIDYNNVTYLTTKWAVWRAPQFLIIKDRGQNLYFYPAQHVSPKADQLREFLVEEGWKEHQPWKTAYAPGGDREWIMDLLARFLKQTYDLASSVPQWVLAMGSATFASLLIRFFHRSDATTATPEPASKAQQASEKKIKEIAPSSPSKSAAPSTPTKSKAGGKKKGGRR